MLQTARKKNLIAFGTRFNVSILEYLGNILEVGLPVLKFHEGLGKIQKLMH